MQRGTQKLCVPTWEVLVRSFIVNGSTVGLLKLGCVQGFLGGSVKNPPGSGGDTRETGSIPGSGRSPREGNGNPLQYSCLGNSMDRGAWWATVHGVAKSQTQLSNFTFTLTLLKTYLLRLFYGYRCCTVRKTCSWLLKQC